MPDVATFDQQRTVLIVTVSAAIAARPQFSGEIPLLHSLHCPLLPAALVNDNIPEQLGAELNTARLSYNAFIPK